MPAIAIIVIVIIAILAISATGYTRTFDDMEEFSSFQREFGTNAPSFKISVFAEAIARHENVDPAHNNPGAITPPGWNGPTFGEGNAIFSTVDEGWSRLYFQLWLIATGQSKVYALTDTIENMARKWTSTQPKAWAQDVAKFSGYTPQTTLQEALV